MAPGGALFYALLLLTFTLASFQKRQQPRTQLGHAQSRRPIPRGLLFTCIVLVVDTELVYLRPWISVSSCVYVWMFVRVYTWRRTVVGVCRICCCCCVSGWEFLGLPLLFVYVGLVYVSYGWLPPYSFPYLSTVTTTSTRWRLVTPSILSACHRQNESSESGEWQ